VAGGAFSSARSAVSSWFTSIANDWKHEGDEDGTGGREKGAGQGEVGRDKGVGTEKYAANSSGSQHQHETQSATKQDAKPELIQDANTELAQDAKTELVQDAKTELVQDTCGEDGKEQHSCQTSAPLS
jgi:hypothetical protein